MSYAIAKMKDDLLSCIIESSHFSLGEIGWSFNRLGKSFDKLLLAIETAKEKDWSLSRTVDVMQFEGEKA